MSEIQMSRACRNHLIRISDVNEKQSFEDDNNNQKWSYFEFQEIKSGQSEMQILLEKLRSTWKLCESKV